MSFDDDGVKQAAAAFFRNDPYYPRPNQPLWEAFKKQYIHTSATKNTNVGSLPEKFIQLIKEKYRKADEHH